MSHLPACIDEPINKFASSVGLPGDQLRLLLCLLLAIPFGELHKRIQSNTGRHWMAIGLGVVYCFFVVGWGVLHVLISALIVYTMMNVMNRRHAPILVYILTLAHLSTLHIYRMYVDYMGWSLDSTLILMVWTVKAVTFGYNVADGYHLAAGESLSPRPAIHDFRASRAIDMPSLVEYLSYVFFFGGVLVGPFFEIKEYLEFSNKTILKKYHLAAFPSTFLPAMKCVGLTLIVYIGMFISSKYPILGYVHTDAYLSLPFLARFQYFWIAIVSSRAKYYFAWYLSEAGCVASGLGLNGVHLDEKGVIQAYKWDRVTNCYALAVEFAPHVQGITNNWNVGANNWLKNCKHTDPTILSAYHRSIDIDIDLYYATAVCYALCYIDVYFRLEPSSAITRYIPAKTFSNVVTKTTSAFWHGFYPSYYLFFISAWLMNEMDDALKATFEPIEKNEEEKNRKKKLRSWWPGPTNLFECISWTLCFLCLNYVGTAFVVLRADYSFIFWKSMYFYGTWLPILVILICRIARPKRRSQERTSTKKSDAATPSSPSISTSAVAPVPASSAPADAADGTTQAGDASPGPLRPRRARSKKAD